MTKPRRTTHARPSRASQPTLPGVLLGVLAVVQVGCASAGMGARSLPPLPSGVRTHATERNYDVRGTSVEEIGRSLEESATAALGPEVAGLHEWDLRWNYRYALRGSACQITELTMELNSVITLPVWNGRDSADPTVAELWDEYVAQLRAHEHGHRVLSYRATREVHRELTRLRVADCDLLPDRAKEVGQSIVERYKEENRVFDADPANRAIWPPSGSP